MKDGQTSRSRKRKSESGLESELGLSGDGAMTVNELLSAISKNEYPDYLIDAIERVRGWLVDSLGALCDGSGDALEALVTIFEHEFYGGGGTIEELFSRLEDLNEYVDIVPNLRSLGGKSDTLVINMIPSDFDSGLRNAIDYAAVFNRENGRRVWILSSAYSLEEIMRFSPHVDALTAQGISLRYILITPWGWTELPLSGSNVTKQQLLWHSSLEANTNSQAKPKVRRQKRSNSSSSSAKNHDDESNLNANLGLDFD